MCTAFLQQNVVAGFPQLKTIIFVELNVGIISSWSCKSSNKFILNSSSNWMNQKVNRQRSLSYLLNAENTIV